MTDLRDKIVDILPPFQDGYLLPEDVADAILAMLEPAPLVWEKLSDRHYRVVIAGSLSWRCEAYSNGDWYLTYSVPGYCDTLIEGKWGSHMEAKTAAQQRHRAEWRRDAGLDT